MSFGDSGDNLKLQPDKCEFLRKEVAFLAHMISELGVVPDTRKIEAVKNFPKLNTAKKSSLGLAGYYRRFVHKFSKIGAPLHRLLKSCEVRVGRKPGKRVSQAEVKINVKIHISVPRLIGGIYINHRCLE